MNALQQPTPHLTPVEPHRRRIRKRSPQQQQRHHPHRGLAVETTAKLAVNLVISVVAVSALAKLLPYQTLQQQKLQEIRAEVEHTEARVSRLQEELELLLAPEQTFQMMDRYSYRVDPNKISIVITPPKEETEPRSSDRDRPR
ncbi:hypothetical protein [Phormidium sp. CCY1219]|uniref:slr1601 family putative cell division protein n=1 Tax=Phormidium sp. CCY1219 TaxID=2886104 RepID=UPI002D1EB9D7|nr:hypothetical protein [Phormidium sp. CCY1219]MEB3828179.1 hypothetical protein [Phormidium sp. CCY1219]